MSEFINCGPVDPESVELEVVECNACGYCLGLDASHLATVAVEIKCPKCKPLPE